MNSVWFLVFLPLIAFLIGISFMGIGTRIVARIQRRYGPPLIQPFIDVIKLLSKDSISYGWVFDMGVWMALAGAALVVYFVPFADNIVLSGKADVVVLMYILAIAPLGMALGTAQAKNPYASIGISRALMLMLGYDLPLVMVILGIITYTGSASFADILSAQQGGIGNWYIFRLPLFAIVYFWVMIAEMGKHPFDVLIAPSEIASGPMVEFSGKYLGYLFIYMALHYYAACALFVNFFMGGAATFIEFYLKMFSVFFVLICISAVMARTTTQRAVYMYWTKPVVLAFIGWLAYLGWRIF